MDTECPECGGMDCEPIEEEEDGMVIFSCPDCGNEFELEF